MDIGVFDSQPTTDEIKIETKTKTEIHEENVVKKDIPQIRLSIHSKSEISTSL